MIKDNYFVCPHCGQSYFTMGLTFTTLACYVPVYKDGVNINPDRNITTTEYMCCNCGKQYIVKTQLGEIIEIKEKEQVDVPPLTLDVNGHITLNG